VTPDTDIVICVRGTRRYPIEQDFQNCIDSLVKTTSHFRLILVDDNSDDVAAAVVERVAKRLQNSILIRTQFQRWFTRAYNLGLRMVRTPRAVILNADTYLGEGWLDEMYGVWADAEAAGHNVGLVGSVLSDAELRRWIGTREPGYVTAHCQLLSMHAITEASAKRGQPGIYLDETRQDAIHIRSDVFICYELNRLGYATIQSHKSRVGHAGGRSWGHSLPDINVLTLPQVSERWG